MSYDYASTLQDLNATLNCGEHKESLAMWSNFWDLTVGNQILTYKHHTIRAGNRWKVGDKFSPRVWSGKPRNSKQIIIAPDIEIKKVFDFEMDLNGIYSINGKYISHKSYHKLANNDGLTEVDMQFWFMPNMNKPKEFKGQIICWDENINY